MTDLFGVRQVTRRGLLAVGTALTGAVGLFGTALPLVASLRPSLRARALSAPVEIDVSDLAPGGIATTRWQGRAIYVVHRTQGMVERLGQSEPRLVDPQSEDSSQPEYARNRLRSARPEFLVLEGVCTHLGCAPMPRFDVAAPDLGEDWPGGFFCPCHGSRFDLSGRVFAGYPAPRNLTVPPHSYVDDGTILIGADAEDA